MNLQNSAPQNIRTIHGNGLAVFLQNDGQLYLKDSRGTVDLLSSFLSGGGGDNIYTADGTIQDAERNVDLDGKILNFNDADGNAMLYMDSEADNESLGFATRSSSSPDVYNQFDAYSDTTSASFDFYVNYDENQAIFIESQAFSSNAYLNVYTNGSTDLTISTDAITSETEDYSYTYSNSFLVEDDNGDVSLSMSSGLFSVVTNDGTNISVIDGGLMSISGFNGMRLNIGVAPAAGSVLSSFNTSGDLQWIPAPAGATGFEALDEGNGIGWRLIGKNPNNYGNIGLDAVDASDSPFATTVRGATGEASFACGSNVTASGQNSFAGGYQGTTAAGDHSFAFGDGSQTTAYGAAAFNSSSAEDFFGFAINNSRVQSGEDAFSQGQSTVVSGNRAIALNLSTSYSVDETTIGRHNTSYTPVSTTLPSALDRIFTVGIGLNAGAQQDAACMLKNGQLGLGISNFEANRLSTVAEDLLQISGSLITDRLIKTMGFTVATLPPATAGSRTHVTDATSTTFNSVVVGGGANTVPVFYNGTNWVIA